VTQFFSKQLRILLATNSLILVSVAMLGPIYALFVKKVGGDLLDASYAFAAFALAAGFTTLVSGRYSDKIKESELIVVLGYLIMGTGFFAYIFVDSIKTLLLVQILIGLGEAIYAPAFDSVYSKHLNGHRSGYQWGAWESINYFTSALGAVLGGYVAIKLGFETMFFFMSILCSVSAIYILLLPRKVL